MTRQEQNARLVAGYRTLPREGRDDFYWVFQKLEEANEKVKSMTDPEDNRIMSLGDRKMAKTMKGRIK
jgi:hypothetical protein